MPGSLFRTAILVALYLHLNYRSKS